MLTIIVEPQRAIECLLSRPRWLLALLVVILAMLGAYFVQRPVVQHVRIVTLERSFSSDPQYFEMSADQKNAVLERAEHPPAIETVIELAILPIFVILSAVINAAILALFGILSDHPPRFGALWSVSINMAVPTIGLFSVAIALVLVLRGVDGFASTLDVLRAIPSALWIAPSATGVLAGFLAGIQVFTIWGCVLNHLVLRSLGIRGALAWAVPVAILLLTAGFNGAASL